MTRINLVDPSLLNKGHLCGEYKELPRVFNLVRAAIERGEKPSDKRNPSKYTLGTGHVRFFYPRLKWCVKRQKRLIQEMKYRGYTVNYDNPDALLEGIPSEWINDWNPSDDDILLNIRRINDRGGKIDV